VTSSLPAPADFGGACLVGECSFDADLLLPTTTHLGLVKAGSYLYGTWRDPDGNLLRAIRAVGADASTIRHLFAASEGTQLEIDARSEAAMWSGPSTIERLGDEVTFAGGGGADEALFRYVQDEHGCSWHDGEAVAVSGRSIGPAVQWFNTWAGGAAMTVTGKYRVQGTIRGVPVEGFTGHEIHYFSPGANWMLSPFGRGREYCWQHIANEYDDGSIVQASFATGADGWGFAMVHDETGAFHASTEVDVEATTRANGYPESLTYRFADQTWTWTIDPQGERAAIGSGDLIGADGTCRREGDDRGVRLSMGNSDWWLDGRAASIERR
jgi:hypothetical protein